MTIVNSLTFVNVVTPKAVSRLELLFDKLASEVGLLNIEVGPMQHNNV